MHSHLQEMLPALVNQHCPILLQDNARPYVAKMTVQKLTDLGNETLPQLPYSPDLSLKDYHLFAQQIFQNQRKGQICLRGFLSFKLQNFYRCGISDLLDFMDFLVSSHKIFMNVA